MSAHASPLGPEVDLAQVSALIRARRTSMLVDRTREVEPAIIEQLCALAIWAPNHKQTWPWRFAAFTGKGREALGEAFAADLQTAAGEGDPLEPARLAKTRTKYTRAPAVLVVGCLDDEIPLVRAENRDAVAAGVQNILLGATAAGLASYWSTPPITPGAATNALCGFGSHDRIVAVIYLGWPDLERSPQTPERPAIAVRHLS